MKRTVVATLLAGISCAVVQSAEAGLIMSVTLNGSNFCVADNNVACGFGVALVDTDATVGRIALADQNIGGIDFTGSAQQATFGPTQNILNTSFLQATNNSGGTITGNVAVSATDFIPPVFNASISGAATFQNAIGSSVDLFWYNDPFNNQGAENPFDRPGTLLDSFSYDVTQIADSFAHNANGIPIQDLALFSMTLATDFILVNGGQITNRGQTEIKPISEIPEPQSLVLLGFGLMYLAARYRKFKK